MPQGFWLSYVLMWDELGLVFATCVDEMLFIVLVVFPSNAINLHHLRY